MKEYYANLTCAGCVIAMALMLCVARSYKSDYDYVLSIQNDKVMKLKTDSVVMMQNILHLTRWHEMTTPEQQREFIRTDKINRIHDKNHILGLK